MKSASFADLLSFYRNHLVNDVMPFWIEHCIDTEHGGLNNCVDDDGTVRSTDKFIWSQGRALWTFSSLYNDFDHDPKWLKIADNIAAFLISNSPAPDGPWPFKLHQDGTVAELPKSIYVDAFVAYGLTEYARATGNPQAIELAFNIYQRTSPLLDDHTTLPTEPHPIPDNLQSHGPSMIFALVYHELALLTGSKEIAGRALELAEIVMTQHLKPDHQLLYEFVHPGGALTDTDAGKTFIPGHVVESMWFMERIYRHHGRQDRIDLATDAIRWHLEKGWDEQYGGLFLACHTQGSKPVWHQPDAKVWWPHTEALYALLRAYQVTKHQWCLDWYWQVHEYTFGMFPDREHGDWHQNLDRRGNVVRSVIKNFPVKDPFHLPRALIYSIPTLKALAAS